MADTKISALTAIVGASLADDDEFVVVDTSSGATLRITRAELHAGLVSGYFASQAEAEAGTNTTKVMTPERTKQAIDALATQGLEHISTATISSDATVDFTAFDATKYLGYLFQFSNVVPQTDNVQLRMRTSADGGSNYDSGASDYASAARRGVSNGTTSDLSDGADSSMRISVFTDNGANEDGVSGHLILPGPDLTKRTSANWQVSWFDTSGNYSFSAGGGARLSSAAVDAVRFFFSSGNLASGEISMFGIRGA